MARSRSSGAPRPIYISDPRNDEVRSFELADGTHWVNTAENIVVMECDSYGDFTDAKFVARLIALGFTLFPESSALINIRPNPSREKGVRTAWLDWRADSRLSILTDDAREMCLVGPAPDESRVFRLLDRFASIGVWCFASLRRPISEDVVRRTACFVDFEAQLIHHEMWDLLIRIDFDGMMLGIMEANDKFDAFHAGMRKEGWIA